MGQLCSGVSGTVRWMIMLSHPDAAARVVSVQGEESQQKFFRHKLGALGGGNDITSGDYTVDEACKFCLTLPQCVGFTYMGELNPPGRVRCYFKSTQAGNDDPAWQTHLLHFTHKVGALGAGNDVESGQYTLEEAYVRCSVLPAAVGFTYQGKPSQQGKLTCHFKGSAAGNTDPNWQTYFKSPGTPQLAGEPTLTPHDLVKEVLKSIPEIRRRSRKEQAHWEKTLWGRPDGWKILVKETLRHPVMKGTTAATQREVAQLLLTTDFEQRAKAQFAPPDLVAKHATQILSQIDHFEAWPKKIQLHYEKLMQTPDGWFVQRLLSLSLLFPRFQCRCAFVSRAGSGF